MNRKALLLITVFAEGGLLMVGLILMRFSHFDLGSRINISVSASIYALLFCLPMLALLFFFDRSNWSPVIRFRGEIDEKVVPIFANSRLPDLALTALLAGIGEELFFRGWMQSLLVNKWGIWAGILVTSAIFGLAHYLSTTYALYAGLIGLYLGVIYLVFGNLFIVISIHALYDFITLLYLQKKRERGKQNAE